MLLGDVVGGDARALGQLIGMRLPPGEPVGIDAEEIPRQKRPVRRRIARHQRVPDRAFRFPDGVRLVQPDTPSRSCLALRSLQPCPPGNKGGIHVEKPQARGARPVGGRGRKRDRRDARQHAHGGGGGGGGGLRDRPDREIHRVPGRGPWHGGPVRDGGRQQGGPGQGQRAGGRAAGQGRCGADPGADGVRDRRRGAGGAPEPDPRVVRPAFVGVSTRSGRRRARPGMSSPSRRRRSCACRGRSRPISRSERADLPANPARKSRLFRRLR
jgi:hypothetical protein